MLRRYALYQCKIRGLIEVVAIATIAAVVCDGGRRKFDDSENTKTYNNFFFAFHRLCSGEEAVMFISVPVLVPGFCLRVERSSSFLVEDIKIATCHMDIALENTLYQHALRFCCCFIVCFRYIVNIELISNESCSYCKCYVCVKSESELYTVSIFGFYFYFPVFFFFIHSFLFRMGRGALHLDACTLYISDLFLCILFISHAKRYSPF